MSERWRRDVERLDVSHVETECKKRKKDWGRHNNSKNRFRVNVI